MRDPEHDLLFRLDSGLRREDGFMCDAWIPALRRNDGFMCRPGPRGMTTFVSARHSPDDTKVREMHG
jgi:hypothetical protein